MKDRKTDSPLFLFAGEQSGDLHGSHLMQSLKRRMPESTFVGVGGPKMRAEGMQCILEMEQFQVMGFTDVFLNLPRLIRHFKKVRDYILKNKLSVVILIDYPGFNLRLAKSLRKHGYRGKIVQYICPSVWAWGKKRIKTMEKSLDLLLTIFPFESNYFSETTLQTKYVGNPLQEQFSKTIYSSDWKKKCGLDEIENHIALFPGSRKGEVERNFPLQLQAAEKLVKNSPEVGIAVSVAQESLRESLQKLIEQSSLKLNSEIFLIPKEYSYDLMRASKSAIAKSGTVTLELALHKTPTVVLYQLTLLNYFIAKYILRLKLPHYCIVNILCGKTVFPELIDYRISSQQLYNHLDKLQNHSGQRQECIEECERLHKILKVDHSQDAAAIAIEELL